MPWEREEEGLSRAVVGEEQFLLLVPSEVVGEGKVEWMPLGAETMVLVLSVLIVLRSRDLTCR